MMKNMVLINGSPRAGKSTSMELLSQLKTCLEENAAVVTVEAGSSLLHGKQLKDFERMTQADAMVIAFPLYVYCMPGMLTEFFEEYRQYVNKAGKAIHQDIYAIINCGFPESRINEDAAAVVRQFCNEIRATYCFSILIGGGGMLVPLKNVPFVKKEWRQIHAAFDRIVDGTRNGCVTSDVHIDSKTPKWLFSFIAEMNFSMEAKKNGIKKKDLFRKPYRADETV